MTAACGATRSLLETPGRGAGAGAARMMDKEGDTQSEKALRGWVMEDSQGDADCKGHQLLIW